MKEKSKLKITILGSGTSAGIPMPACDCPVCKSPHPENKRFRTSILIEHKTKKILIDTSPDLRTQSLNNSIKDIDACIITHDHADHLHGIDDLRNFCFPSNYNNNKFKEIPLFTNNYTYNSIVKKFSYIHSPPKNYLGGGLPLIKFNPFDIKQGEIVKKNILDLDFEFFLLPHGHGQSMGLRIENFAYIIDCHEIPEFIISELKDQLDLLILDCVQIRKHKSHLYLEKSLEYSKLISANKTGLIHFNHELEHFKMIEEFKKQGLSIFPTYDEQVLEI